MGKKQKFAPSASKLKTKKPSLVKKIFKKFLAAWLRNFLFTSICHSRENGNPDPTLIITTYLKALRQELPVVSPKTHRDELEQN